MAVSIGAISLIKLKRLMAAILLFRGKVAINEKKVVWV